MALVLSDIEERRLRRAIELAQLSEFERILWLTGFLSLVVVDLLILVRGTTWAGAAGTLAGWFFLYGRLRAPFLAGAVRHDRGLFGLSLGTREQRAFTGLMLRHVFTGRNPLVERPEHDPFAAFRRRVAGQRQG